MLNAETYALNKNDRAHTPPLQFKAPSTLGASCSPT